MRPWPVAHRRHSAGAVRSSAEAVSVYGTDAADRPLRSGTAASPRLPVVYLFEVCMLTALFLKMTLVGAEWVLYVLVLLSFVSVGIIVDRLWYFMEHRVDVADLAAKLEQLLRAGDLKSAWQLVAGSDAIECVVVAAGLAAVTGARQACSEAMLSAKARTRSRLEARSGDAGNHRQQCPVHWAAGDSAGHRESRPRYVVGTVVARRRSQRGHGRRVRGVGGHGRRLCVAIPAVVAFNLLQRRVRTTNAQSIRWHIWCCRACAPSEDLHSRWQLNRGESMAGKVASSYDDDEAGVISDINVTPLVDVTLVLLIVFMITVPAIVGSAQFKVDLPESIAADPTVAEFPLRLAVRREADRQDRPVLERSGERTKRRFEETGGRHRREGSDPPALLAADKSVAYGEVVKVIDLLTALGLHKVSLETRRVAGTDGDCQRMVTATDERNAAEIGPRRRRWALAVRTH